MHPIFAFCAIALVLTYYVVIWLWLGKDPKPGTIVTQYEPPRGYSPAFIRFCWKQGFDERVLWAAILNLVAKKFLKLEPEQAATRIQVMKASQGIDQLPAEERI